MRAKLAPRRVRDLRPQESRKQRDINPGIEHPKPRLVPFDIPSIFGGKRAYYPQVRASIKGYRKMERKLNPPPKYKVLGPFKVYV